MEYLHRITIKPSDIDQNGHVNNVVYLGWVQEAAAAHWNHVASEEMKRDCLWIISRHEIDYIHPCFLSTPLVAKTWVGSSEGARSERFVEIIETTGLKLMARVKTTWFLLDAGTRRPKRVDASFTALFGK